MRARDVAPHKIVVAIEFVREPLATMFNARHTKGGTLRDTDNVTLTLQQLGHLMAWYAECTVEAMQPPAPQIGGSSAMELPRLPRGDA